MRINLMLGVALLAGVAAALTVSNLILSVDSVSQDHSCNLTGAFDISLNSTAPVTAAADNEYWTANVARGRKFLEAMKDTDLEATTIFKMDKTAKSKHDGHLKAEMGDWS
ncbi:hypothetical protein BU25DRAFT_460927 [Macroventuria anomochaeta]|uniref:Uncharacterized protein n=1 Tax=Macroventuria anomochaeta TaxID=301207 RepID=A0ACB6RUY9_9PLEO|nr:uncharacterized protein BU25DRAFT_460927 [Macroventuria anomochaeta]KAF2624759.1 hypothetical protein BU25DRAFT_460927 [Macroventuria anomochaeta]